MGIIIEWLTIYFFENLKGGEVLGGDESPV